MEAEEFLKTNIDKKDIFWVGKNRVFRIDELIILLDKYANHQLSDAVELLKDIKPHLVIGDIAHLHMKIDDILLPHDKIKDNDSL